MLIGYARTSKVEPSQVRDVQRAALADAGIKSEHIFEDCASGMRDDLFSLIACLEALRVGDTLVVWKLDRLAIDLKQLVNVVADLTSRQVGLKVLAGEGAAINTTTSHGHLVAGIFAALAEVERELSVAGAKAELEEAKALARLGGRPLKMTPAMLRVARAAMRSRETKISDLCSGLGISRQTLYRFLSPTGEIREDGKRLLERSLSSRKEQQGSSQ